MLEVKIIKKLLVFLLIDVKNLLTFPYSPLSIKTPLTLANVIIVH